MGLLRELVDLIIRLFALGLFVSVVLDWIMSGPAVGFRRRLDQLYEPFLKPIQRYVRPIKLSPTAPTGIDLSPLVLLLAIYWLVHPFIMWVLGA